jgi:AhpD family alkylhydroperoxidase
MRERMCQPVFSHESHIMSTYKELLSPISATLGTFRKEIPDTMAAFAAMGKAATQDGALDKKTKELIALALAVGGRCDPCIGYHAQAVVKAGASRAEVEEMLAMCVYMGGGPSLMYAAKCLQAFEEFGGEKSAAV